MKLFKHTLKADIMSIIVSCIVNSTYYLFVRYEKNIFYGTLFRAYKQLLRLISVYPYRTMSHQEYINNHPTSSIQTIIENRTGFTSNVVFGIENADLKLIPVRMSDIYVAKHKNVKLQGNSDYIINKAECVVINDFNYNVNPGIENRDGTLLKQKDSLLVLRYDDENCRSTHESGIILSGKFSFNYYHVIYEILIKLLILEKVSIPDDVPLIIDRGIFEVESFKAIFESLNSSNRDIVLIDKNEVMSFNNLYWISSVNEIPAHIKNPSDCLIEDIKFDITLLHQMRERLLIIKSERQFPKKFFIARKTFKRRSFNEDEVISLLKRYGFGVISPEEYLFAEQIALFNNAELIIGGSGAALSNLLFCNKGCKVICLYSMKIKSPIFSTIAYANGVDFRYFIGEPVDSLDLDNLHADFHVDIEKLKMMLDKLIKQ